MSAPLRPVVFALAGIAAPLIVTALCLLLAPLGMPVFIVGLGGLFIGVVSYVVLGLPVMFLAARRYGTRIVVFVLAAVLANIGSPLVLLLQDQWIGPSPTATPGRFMVLGWLYGTGFAVVWGAAAGLLYRLIDRAAPRRQ